MARYTVPHADPRRRSGVLTAGATHGTPWSPPDLAPPVSAIVPSADGDIPVVTIIRAAT